MVIRYRMVRMPLPVYEKYDRIRRRMITDIEQWTGKKNVKLSLSKTMNVIVNPYFNENFIQVDLKKLYDLSKKKRGQYE